MGADQPYLLAPLRIGPATTGEFSRCKNSRPRPISGRLHDLYVLDEFNNPLKWGWIDIDDVVDTLANRPGKQHVVITGRDPHPRLLEIADVATEMTKIKHPFDRGQKGQKGIEW